MIALLIPTMLSCLVLAAHFFRGGHVYLMLGVCAAPLLLVLRRVWSMRIVQAILVIGALEWVRTLLQIRAIRIDEGRDWQRMAWILGGVAVFTFVSALLLSVPAIRRAFSPGDDRAPKAAAG
jgi:hypothetical protein